MRGMLRNGAAGGGRWNRTPRDRERPRWEGDGRTKETDGTERHRQRTDRDGATDECERKGETNLSLLPVTAGETAIRRPLLLLWGGLFGGGSLLILLVGAAGFGLFLAGLLLCGFGGFIAHDFDFLLRG